MSTVNIERTEKGATLTIAEDGAAALRADLIVLQITLERMERARASTAMFGVVTAAEYEAFYRAVTAMAEIAQAATDAENAENAESPQKRRTT